jgi:D-sedoheptulose 7-phosphate isomerase
MLGATLNARSFLERVGQELLRVDTKQIQALADAIYECYEKGKFVFICGNGGSGSNASHFCEDLGKSTLKREDFENGDGGVNTRSGQGDW